MNRKGEHMNPMPTYIPEDALCFFVFDAPSRRDAVLVAQPAGLEPIRVVEAVPSRKEET